MSNISINVFIAIGIGYLLAQMQIFLETDFLINFLKDNLIMLLVALIAINSATLSIVLTKIRELQDTQANEHFINTRQQMVLSIQEQITLIAFAIILLMILDSSYIKNNVEYIIFLNTLIIATFIYAIRILYDTAKSVFVILDY